MPERPAPEHLGGATGLVEREPSVNADPERLERHDDDASIARSTVQLALIHSLDR